MSIGVFDNLTWRMDPSISYSDWTIVITSKESTTPDMYHVHRNVLAVGPRHSEYFAAQFQLKTQETMNMTSQISLEEHRADVFPLMLDFFYSGNVPTLTAASAAALHNLSEYFDVPKLRLVVEEYYRKNLTMSTLVDFISHAKQHHAQALLEIAVEKSVQHLLEIDVATARQLGPDLLLQILEKNCECGNRRFGFHSSKLVAECCRHNDQSKLSIDTFHQLTAVQILPYMDPQAAVYLLCLDSTLTANASSTSSSATTKSLTCLQKRCTQAITEKWKYIRNQLPTNEDLSTALSSVPSHILIDILMKATSELSIGYEVEEKETRYDAPPRILVQGAGNSEVNGVYSRDNLFQGVSMYTRPGMYKDEQCLFSMFQCLVGSKTKRWFISVIPSTGRPGTNKDIDFFSALVTNDCLLIPPQTGWRKSSDGEDPCPTLLF